MSIATGARRCTRSAEALVAVALAGLLHAGAAQAQPSPALTPSAPLELEAMTSVELRRRVADGCRTALLPIGGTEQNGAHMALGKHNARARLLALRIAQALGDAVVLPVMAYVPEGETDPPSSHMRYAGTLSLPPSLFAGLVESAVRSVAAHGLRTVVLLGDHGGYQRQLAEIARRLDGRVHGVRVIAPAAYFQAQQAFGEQLQRRGFSVAEIGQHAGLADTALTLALAPELVRRDQLAGAAHEPGVRGDPAHATAALGEEGVALIVRETVAALAPALSPGRPSGR